MHVCKIKLHICDKNRNTSAIELYTLYTAGKLYR